jgi:hypothetical protein
MKAYRLLKENIDALLRRDHLDRKDLAQWCRKSESWISKIYKEDRRSFSTKDLDRIADLFGYEAYQLFQPGIGSVDRRSGLDRRTKQERRITPAERVMLATAKEIDSHHPRRKGVPHVAIVASSPIRAALEKLSDEYRRRALALLSQAESGGQTAAPRKALPARRQSRRSARGSDAETS